MQDRNSPEVRPEERDGSRFQAKEPTEHYHRLKRTCLLFCSGLLLTFIPNIRVTSASLTGISFEHVDINYIRGALFLAATYYLIGYLQEFYHDRRLNNSLAINAGEAMSALRAAKDYLDQVANLIGRTSNEWNTSELRKQLEALHETFSESGMLAKMNRVFGDSGFKPSKFVQLNADHVALILFKESIRPALQTIDTQRSERGLPSLGTDFKGLYSPENWHQLIKAEVASALQQTEREFVLANKAAVEAAVITAHSELKAGFKAAKTRLDAIKSPVPQLDQIRRIATVELPQVVRKAESIAGRYTLGRWVQLYMWDLGAAVLMWCLAGGFWAMTVAGPAIAAARISSSIWPSIGSTPLVFAASLVGLVLIRLAPIAYSWLLDRMQRTRLPPTRP